jgi:hypothetical protein
MNQWKPVTSLLSQFLQAQYEVWTTDRNQLHLLVNLVTAMSAWVVFTTASGNTDVTKHDRSFRINKIHEATNRTLSDVEFCLVGVSGTKNFVCEE